MLKTIKGIEVFSTGIWNDESYTEHDLDDMVIAFNETKDKIKPHLKLGHNPDQKLLANDGLPAAGWVGHLYRVGTKLMADFIDIPDKIHQLLEKKAYRKVSSEIYWNIDIGNGKTFKRMLSAVALLGSDMPAVSNLNDILALYGIKDYDGIKSYFKSDNSEAKIYSYNIGEHVMPKTENEIKLELELKSKEAELKQYNLDKEKSEKDIKDAKEVSDKEIKELKEYKAKADKEKAELIEANQKKEIESSITNFETQKLITPAMKPYVLALLDEGKKEYSFKETNKDKKEEDKKYSRSELIEKILKLHSATDVNFDENSTVDKEDEGSKTKADLLDKKIKSYSKEHKVSYSDAYKQVMGNNQE